MASYNVSSNIDHVLPTHFWGLYTAFYDMDVNGVNSTFVQYAKDLNMEVWRFHPNVNHRFYTPGDPVVDGMKNFILSVQGTAGTKTLVQVTMAPLSYPADSLTPWDPTNVRVASDPRSPTSVANGLLYLINAGIDVAFVEIGNEYTLASASATPLSDGWYVNSAFGYDNATLNQHWANYHFRDYVNAVRNVAPNMRIYGMATATGRLYADPFVQQFIDCAVSGKFNRGSNAPYFDGLTFHPYSSPTDTNGNVNSDPQATLNGIVYPTDVVDKAAWCFDTFRQDLDSRGLQSKTLATTEQTILARFDSVAGLADILYAIRGANKQAQWNLEYLIYTEYTEGNIVGVGPSFSRNCRYFTLRDMISPFLRKYKRIANSSVVVSPGLTPASGTNNAVDSVQISTGYDTNGNLGILLANVDLTTSKTVTLTLPGIPTGIVSGKKLSSGASAPTDIGQVTVTTTSITTGSSGIPALGPGEALFLEMPGVGSGGGTITIPNSKISSLSDNFNGNVVSNLWTNIVSGSGTTLADTNQRLEITTSGTPTLDWFQLALDSADQLGIRSNGSNLEAYKIIGGTTTALGTVALPTLPIYIQIREGSGTITFEWGTDPTAVMTSIATLANPFAITALQTRIGSGGALGYAELQSQAVYDLTSDKCFLQYLQQATSGSPAIFDNCNTAAVSSTDLGGWSTSTQINATDPVSSPITLDVGNWTTGTQINAQFINTQRIGTIAIRES